MDSMAETAENVAEEYQISREDQDAFAYRSQQRAAAAIAKRCDGGRDLPRDDSAAQGRACDGGPG